MVNAISSLQPKACTFVFCQFTSNPRDAASLAIVSNMGTRSSCSSARRETSEAAVKNEFLHFRTVVCGCWYVDGDVNRVVDSVRAVSLQPAPVAG